MLNVTKSNTANVVDKTYLKNWLRISGTAEDDILDDLIKGAQDAIERMTGLCMTASVIIAQWYPFSGDEQLPYTPYTATTTIVSDSTDVSDSYTITDKIVGTPTDELTITYTAGYTTNLPAGLKNILLRLITNWYYNRGDTGNIPKDILNELSIYTRNLML